MKSIKIQTGLRIPEPTYNKLREDAERSGVSINNQILFLLDIGMKTIDLGIQEQRRALPRTERDTDE